MYGGLEKWAVYNSVDGPGVNCLICLPRMLAEAIISALAAPSFQGVAMDLIHE
jgi:molybdopterin biosynthesis enzyme